MKKITILFLLLCFQSCLKLDSNLYNNDNTVNEYRLDDYDGEQDFVLDASYALPLGFVNLLSLSSQTKDEKEATTIKAVYIGDMARINTDTVILYCHGTRWHIDFYWQRAKLLAHANGKNRYGVLMPDYRGYGLSGGKPTEDGLYADVEACMKWLKERGLQNERLIIYGFSLGSAPACELSAHPGSLRPSKIILEAPFASSEVMVQDASQLNMPASYFTELKIDNAEEIKQVEQPFLWIHGDHDNFLNYRTHGEVVYNNHKGTYKEKFTVKGADHNNVPEIAGFENYLKTIGTFIRRK